MSGKTKCLSFGLLLLCFGAGSGSDIVQAAVSKKISSPGDQSTPAHAHRRGPKQFSLSQTEGTTVTLWKPDLTTRQLSPEMGVITLPPTGMDNYHAVVVERDWGSSKETIIRYEYLRGKPSGESPQRLAEAHKSEFEIVPEPIPREHYHYFSDQTWAFSLRFKGQPLADQPVVLETSNGSRLVATTDHQGWVRFRLPDDFTWIVEGAQDKRRAELALTSQVEDSGIVYETMLTAEYRVSPKHWQSTTWGVAIAGVGFLFGGFITRFGRRKVQGVKR